MGFGGPLGGYISDKLGWRWAFLIQMPLFLVSFCLTGYNLRYVTPVRLNFINSTTMAESMHREKGRAPEKFLNELIMVVAPLC